MKRMVKSVGTAFQPRTGIVHRSPMLRSNISGQWLKTQASSRCSFWYSAVLQDVISFEETQEMLALLKLLALGNQDGAAGGPKPVTDVVSRLRAKRAAG